MESITNNESTTFSSPTPLPPKNGITSYCSVAPSDSMKDMDWLNSIELTKLNDSTRTSLNEVLDVGDRKMSIDVGSTLQSPTGNDVFEKSKSDTHNFKNIRNIIDKIQAKSIKEKMDTQLLEKLTKLLNVSPSSKDNIADKSDNSDSIDESDSTHKINTDEQVVSKTNLNDKNSTTSSEDIRNFLISRKSPSKGESVFEEDKLKPLDYKNDNTLKPPYSYSTLIKMAMKSNHKECITLLNIYEWIKTNFAYYRSVDSCWQNSIRHNLSLNKCFVRVPRESGDHGKGGYWKYVESNDTSDSRYSTKTYNRSLSSGMPSLNCYRSKKYHRRNNKNLSVIVQPFDQFQPQQIIQPFTNLSFIQNQFTSNFNNNNTNNNHNNINNNNIYGYQNPYVSPPSTNIYGFQSYGENNPPVNVNSAYQQLQALNPSNSNTEMPNIYNKSLLSHQMILPNRNVVGSEFRNNQTTIGTDMRNNFEEVNPILEAMKYPLTYYNNLNQSNNHSNISNGDFVKNTNLSSGNNTERELTQSFMDSTAATNLTSNNTLLPGLYGDNTNRFPFDLLNSLTTTSNNASFEFHHQPQDHSNMSNINYNNNLNNNNSSLTDTTTDFSSGPIEYKSFPNINLSNNNFSVGGNELYNYYLNELGISQQQQQHHHQQINPQIQRLYNVLGENTFNQH